MSTEIAEDYADAVLTGQTWERRSFERCDFTDADLRDLVTKACTFTNCDFTRADLGDSKHSGTAFRGCTFNRTVFASSRFDGCTLLGSTFTDCRLRGCAIRDTDLSLAGLGRVDLRKLPLVTIDGGVLVGELALPAVALWLFLGKGLVAPGVCLPFQLAAGGKLPFGLGGQSFPGPLRVGDGVVPGNVDDRVILPPFEIAVWPFGMPPVRAGRPLPPL